MTEYKQIIGKIAKIQDKYRVIINKGASDGVTKNMKFYVYEEGEEIIDPDTKEIIENEEIVKAYLKVIHIQEKIAILESDETETIVKKVPGLIESLTINGLASSTTKRDVMKPLNVGMTIDDEIDLTIKVGNFVKSIKTDGQKGIHA
ncbi:MAG: hypothetical protein PHS54_06540 [Clostridia bacterium]|nr:hypothetical protein [Clostridia bacterium]